MLHNVCYLILQNRLAGICKSLCTIYHHCTAAYIKSEICSSKYVNIRREAYDCSHEHICRNLRSSQPGFTESPARLLRVRTVLRTKFFGTCAAFSGKDLCTEATMQA